MKNQEIERKFLVDRRKWDHISKPPGLRYIQGYLSIDDQKTVRVRVAGEEGFLTIKGRSDTFSRPEFEYAIPLAEAIELIRSFTPARVEKTRFKIHAGRYVWEVDEFHGDNGGLLMAEIELESPEDVVERPEWLGEEVTGDNRYFNSYLARFPYSTWK